jgi:hypothetical protein
LKLYKHVYYHGTSYLCEEWVNDGIDYKIKLEIPEMFFYQDDEGTWHPEWGSFDMVRKIKLKLKMWKMVGDEIHYKSEETLSDINYENEW